MTSDLLQVFLQTASVAKLRQHLTLGTCSLLKAAANGEQLDFTHEDESWDGLRRRMQVWERGPHTKEPERVFFGFPLFASRFALIQAFQRGFDADKNSRQSAPSIISAVVREIANAWEYRRLPKTKRLDNELLVATGSFGSGPREPSFMLVLSSRDPNLAKVLRECASVYGWSHPGLQIAGETLAALAGDFREPELSIRAKVIFASDSLSYPRGIVAPMTLERLPDGCGMLIPSAYHCNYLWMRGGSFENSLQNARLAVLEHIRQQGWSLTDTATYDWRWRLDLWSATESFQQKACHLPLTGRSAEVAFACGMIAAARGNPDNANGIDPLDRSFTVTASLPTQPSEVLGRVELIDDPNLPMQAVKSVKSKTILFENVPLGELARERISSVVVSECQLDSTLPDDPRYEFFKAVTLAKAYELLVRFPRITRGVNRSIAAECGQALAEYCTPYIEPDVADVSIWRKYRQDNPKSTMPPREAFLNADDLRRLTHGELILAKEVDEADEATALPCRLCGNRVFIEAESGQGKSMFLLRCQQIIAQEKAAEVLPLRFGRTLPNDGALSQVPWDSLDAESLLEETAIAKHLSTYAQQLRREHQYELSKTDELDWMNSMLRHGRVVFLLDALDQTLADQVYRLGPQLSKKTFFLCPVIITGRPEAWFSREAALSKNEWCSLCLVPFDKIRWNKFLGTETIEDSIDEAILSVPLLLHMLKPLLTRRDASGKVLPLDRQQLYEQSISRLLEKGSNRDAMVGKTSKLPNPTLARIQLGKIAWHMVREQGFLNDLRGTSFDLLEGELGADVIEELDWLDLTTASQLIEPGTGRTGLSFRHRSFQEYFVAWHLTSTLEPMFCEADLLKVLREIHQVPLDGQELAQKDPEFWSPAEWENTIRFMLSLAEGKRLEWLACRLIELGNPWIVNQSLNLDSPKLPSHIEHLTRWLVHRDSTPQSQITGVAKVREKAPVSLGDAQQAFQQSGLDVSVMQMRSTRGAEWLTPLRELGYDLNRYYTSTSRESALLERMKFLGSVVPQSTWDFLDSFVSIGAGTFDIGQCENPVNSLRRSNKVPIQQFELADFPVTNALFELFCPTKLRTRDANSNQPDQPAVFVSWYMATEFCQWLSALSGQTYRLPTEWEWEWACRWLFANHRLHTPLYYWWGDKSEHPDAFCFNLACYRGTRARTFALEACQDREFAHPSWRSPEQCGLLDLFGNVWEWCESARPGDKHYAALCGEATYTDEVFCAPDSRYYRDKDNRDPCVGFRVCRS